VRALPAPPKKERIGYLPYNAPLHRIHPKDMLPTRLLTPFQAENDYHVKDTYNYMTVQTDIRQPKRHLAYIEDEFFHDVWERALRVAVDRIQVRLSAKVLQLGFTRIPWELRSMSRRRRHHTPYSPGGGTTAHSVLTSHNTPLQSEAKDVRVLNMGAGAGLLAMEVLRLGAYHVTCSERWLYLAMVCKEILLSNGFSDDQVRKRHGRLATFDSCIDSLVDSTTASTAARENPNLSRAPTAPHRL
jgi:protein arginine N-methyltransferase 7